MVAVEQVDTAHPPALPEVEEVPKLSKQLLEEQLTQLRLARVVRVARLMLPKQATTAQPASIQFFQPLPQRVAAVEQPTFALLEHLAEVQVAAAAQKVLQLEHQEQQTKVMPEAPATVAVVEREV